MEPRQLLASVVVTSCADDGSVGTLRWAILQINQDQEPGLIRFAVPGDGSHVIGVSSPLPALTTPAVIDGSSQPGYAGTPLIRIDGSSAGTGSAGITIVAGSSIVRGLSITQFSGAGLLLQDGGGNLIEANRLGTDPTGSQALPNGDGLQILGSSSNTVGGVLASASNLISGNLLHGIHIAFAGRDATGNVVQGNLIGTSSDGSSPIANRGAGIYIDGATANMIGGAVRGAGNVVSANLGDGIILLGNASSNLLQGNLIGTTSDGLRSLGNQADGIRLIAGGDNIIGGTAPGTQNVISGNLGHGIETLAGAPRTLIQGNAIGTDRAGTRNLGNRGNGVLLGSSRNSVGSLASGAGNVIAFNGTGLVGAGVQLAGMVLQNSILSNSIHDNAGLGINLGSGPTPNRPTGQSGPNEYQNYPMLAQAQTDGRTTRLTTSLVGAPGTTYLVQYFWSPIGDPSGYGEGQYLLGSSTLPTDARGNASASIGLGAVPPNSVISATATDSDGNTSEFSPQVSVRGLADLAVALAATPDPIGVGANLTYTITVRNMGFLDAHNVVLSAALPWQATLVSAGSSQGAPIIRNGPALAANLGTLPAGASASLVIVVQVQGSAGTSLSCSASVSQDEIDPTPGNNSATVTTPVVGTADLAVQFVQAPATVPAGGRFTWTLIATNQGPSTSHGVTVSVPLSGLGFTSASLTQGTAAVKDGLLLVSLGDLAAGAKATIAVDLTATSVGVASSTAVVSSTEYDPALANNAATAVLTVLPTTDLRLTLASDVNKAAPAQVVNFSILVFNAGADATGVVVSDLLPAGLSLVSATSDLGASPVFAADTGVLTASIGDLPAGATATIRVAASVVASPGQTLLCSASVGSSEFDTDPSDNVASCPLPIRGRSALSVSLAPDAQSVPLGKPLTLTITVQNQGPDVEPNAVVTIPVPGHVRLVSAASDQGTGPILADGVVTAGLGAIAPGGFVHLSLVLSPGIEDVGTITLLASASGDNVNPDPSAADAEVTVAVAPACGLGVSIDAPSGAAQQGVDIAYFVDVINGGPFAAQSVVLSSTLDPGLSFVGASIDGLGVSPVLSGGQLSLALGDLGIGESVRVRIAVKPIAATTPAGGLELNAVATSGTFDDDLSDNAATASLVVAPSVDLVVQLSAANAEATVTTGDSFTLTAALTNLGPSTATGVVLKLPVGAKAAYVSSTSSRGNSPMLASGLLLVPVGNLAPGARATVSVVLQAVSPGAASWTATVTGQEFDLDSASSSSQAELTITEPPGSLAFAASMVDVREDAGYVDVAVVRSSGAQGVASVSFQTIGGTATPGVDYVPVSGILTFAEGETVKTIRIPILANPHDQHDEYFGLTLNSPTHASLGLQSTSVVRIIELDPDFTPPTVAALHWDGSSGAITSIVATFSEPIQASTALVSASYQLADLGTSGLAQAGVIQSIAVRVVAVDPSGLNLTLVPSQPLPSGHFFRLTVAGSGPLALRDLAGNPLAGSPAGPAGSDYVGLFGQSNNLKYNDRNGNLVSIRVIGPGYLELVRDASGEGQVLRLQAGVPGATTITGTVTRARGRGVATTTLDTVEGLGQFGEIRVKLSSPPFLIRHYPFFLNTGRPMARAPRPAVVPRIALRPAARRFLPAQARLR